MLEYWIWLSTRTCLREQIAVELLGMFRDVKALYLGRRQDYITAAGIRPSEVNALCDKSMDGAMEILKTCHMHGIHIVTYCDAAYPERLRNIPDPPMVLYYKGCMPNFDAEPTVTLVGTRNASVYGCHVARQLGFQIARCGGLVVSGMAVGIDATATDGALEGGNRAVGVLACGVDVVYPAATAFLREKLERCGCLISEYPPGARANKLVFHRRNRILSGLSCGVVVVEAPLRSGALITARHALEQGRDVFAVPGNVDAYNSAGCNDLLSNGARAVRFGWDVMREYEFLYPDRVHHWVGGVDLSAHFKSSYGADWLRQHYYKNPETAVKSPVKSVKVEEIQNKTVDNREETPYSDDDQPSAEQPKLTEDEKTVLALLSRERKQVDQVIEEAGMMTGRVLAALTLLEVKGLVCRHPGKFYSLPE